jgi:uncharacterized caspase-like protein
MVSEQFEHGYALLIGVGACAYPAWSLPVAVHDVRAVAQVLADPHGCAYLADDQHLCLLHDGEATREAILQGLTWLQERTAADPSATAILYYSGHGWLDAASQRYYLIPHNVKPNDLADSALAADALQNALHAISAKRMLVVLDCCHAGGMATAKANATLELPSGFIQRPAPKTVIRALKAGAGRAIFSSSREDQRSWVRPDGRLSIFTQHLVEALRGAGNRSGERQVRLSNLMNHLAKMVPISAAQLCQSEQTPFFDTASEDFAVALAPANLDQQSKRPLVRSNHLQHPPSMAIVGERNVVSQKSQRNNLLILGDRVNFHA